MPSDARTLIAIRVVVVTTLVLAALIIQYTVRELLPINYLYTTAGVTYALTLFYIGVGRVVGSRKLNLAIQTAGDLLVETLLVYATALLTSYLSEKLQKTAQNLAVLRALNENVVESIPSGLITLSPDGVSTFINPAGRAILQRDDASLFTEEEWHQVREELSTGL